MSDRPILTRVASAVADALSPLEAAFASPVAMAQFLTELGWPVLAEELTNANTAFGSLPQAIADLTGAAAALESGSGDLTAATGAVEDAIQAVASAARGLTRPADVSALPPIMQDASFWAAFAFDVVDFLLYTYLEKRQSMVFTALRLLGVLRTEAPPRATPELSTARSWTGQHSDRCCRARFARCRPTTGGVRPSTSTH